MKKLIRIVPLALVISGALCLSWPESLLTLKIGPSWPQALLSTGIPSGDGEIDYGIMIDKKVGFGLSADFLWNVQSTTTRTDTGGHNKTLTEQKTFMFPIMGFFVLDPVPKLIVHPVGRFQIGYNSMIYSYKVAIDNAAAQPLSPYFYGLIIKAGVDALYNLGENSSLFLGLEYSWAGTRTADNPNGEFDKKDMSGVGIRAGIRVLM